MASCICAAHVGAAFLQEVRAPLNPLASGVARRIPRVRGSSTCFLKAEAAEDREGMRVRGPELFEDDFASDLDFAVEALGERVCVLFAGGADNEVAEVA
jgi:hypothetical protein